MKRKYRLCRKLEPIGWVWHVYAPCGYYCGYSVSIEEAFKEIEEMEYIIK